jgi:hypothetical protein
VQRPRTVGAGAQPARAGLGGEREVTMTKEQLDHGRVKGGEALGGRGTRAEWRCAPQQGFLEVALMLVEQGEYAGSLASASCPAASRSSRSADRRGAPHRLAG